MLYMKKPAIYGLLFSLLAVVALAQVTPTGRFARTFPPTADEIVVGSAGPAEIGVTELTCNGVPAPAQKINNNGEIVGWCYDGADAEAAIFRSGAWVRLGEPTPPGWTFTAGFGISPSGAVVGYGFVSPPNTWGPFYAPSGATAVTFDGGPGEGVGNIPPDAFNYGINDSLNRVGCRNRYDDTFPDPYRAFFFAHPATLDELTDEIEASTYGPYWDEAVFDNSCARDINSSNNVVGEIIGTAQPRGFFYSRSLDTVTVLGPVPTGTTYLTNAKAINESDVVVGEGRLTDYTADHAVKWVAGVISSLGVAEYSDAPFNSRPNDINDNGDSCGMMFLLSGETAFIALADGTVVNLNTLSGIGQVTLQECYGINNSRAMVVKGFHAATPGTTRYYLVTYIG